MLAARDLGVGVRVCTTVTAIEERGNELIVHARGPEGDTEEVAADLVVTRRGTRARDRRQGLDVAGVERADNGGVAVNEHLQSVSSPDVYAAGDAAGSGDFPLTPVARMQAGVVVTNRLGWRERPPSV